VVERFLAFVREHEHCFERECFPGHVTGSAWLVNGAGTHVLLTHHKKLGRWLQLGGHADGETDPLVAATREAEEESGLVVEPVREAVFDVDIHEIPARGPDPLHLHYDVRFALRCRENEDFRVSDSTSTSTRFRPVARIPCTCTTTCALPCAAARTRISGSATSLTIWPGCHWRI
jgi:8-oxo-dGTP pyrophosphatase MutT (NUDIX family)